MKIRKLLLKSFIKLGHGVNAITLFTAVINNCS